MDTNTSGRWHGSARAKGRPQPATEKQLNKLSFYIRTTREIYGRLQPRHEIVRGTRVDYTLYDAETWMRENLTIGMASRVIAAIDAEDYTLALQILAAIGMRFPDATT